MLFQTSITILALFAGGAIAAPAKEDMEVRSQASSSPSSAHPLPTSTEMPYAGVVALQADAYVSLHAVESKGIKGGGWGGEGYLWTFPFSGTYSQAPFTAFFFDPKPTTSVVSGKTITIQPTPTSTVMCTLGASGTLNPTSNYDFNVQATSPHATPTAVGPAYLNCA